ncbi:MAG: formyltetrahydrofolate deformylase [Candidatus Schekmanbacteria bacterium]|nr:MAG: formyltetrahydrofolate deformylase [Candidatus Schekmanbacteria bacterium]
MMKEKKVKAVLLLHCPDQIGLVARISSFIAERGGNIIDLDEHVDTDEKVFYLRILWEISESLLEVSAFKSAFTPIAEKLNAKWDIKMMDEKMRVAIFVSKYAHCLQEILWRYSLGEFNIEIPLIISNHPNHQELAQSYGIPYYVFAITKENKVAQERKELELLIEHKIDTIVLARYMQIITPVILDKFRNRIINIHHSFLPAFAGSNPYRQAYERGVKLIGATSHYVTEELDEGPIIEQDITRVTHRDSVEDLKRKGRDLERLVLAKALRLHTEHRIFVRGRKTIVFE